MCGDFCARKDVNFVNREEDVERKLNSLKEYMHDRDADGALITSVENFAWATSGARSYIALSDKDGVASLFVTKDKSYVISQNPETERLKREELPQNFSVVEYPWFAKLDDMIAQMADGTKILYEEDPEFNNFLFRNRVRLSSYEQEKYAEVGEKTARALEKGMRNLTPKMTEIQSKAIIENELSKEGLDILLILVFGNESRSLYRHNLPRNVKIGEKCFVSVCTKMYGLVISATRAVEFRKDEEFERQHVVNSQIDSEIINASFEKSLMSQIFFVIEKSYESHGYPEEWKLHHQGGIAGYKTREFVAIPHFPFEVGKGVAFAWNPTITGTKSEDTYVRTEKGMKLLSVDNSGTWPYLEFEINGRKYRRPNVLTL